MEKNSGQNAVFFHITSIQDLVFDITINIFDNYGRCTKMLIKWGQTISMLNIKSAFFRYQYHQFHYYYISMRFHTTLTMLCQCKSLKDFPGTITHVTEKWCLWRPSLRCFTSLLLIWKITLHKLNHSASFRYNSILSLFITS